MTTMKIIGRYQAGRSGTQGCGLRADLGFQVLFHQVEADLVNRPRDLAEELLQSLPGGSLSRGGGCKAASLQENGPSYLLYRRL